MRTWRIITYIFLGLCLAGGIYISFSCFGYHHVDVEEELPFYISLGGILGPYLMMLPILLLSYIIYGPFESKRPLAVKIITPFITAIALAGIVFLVVLVIPKDPATVEPGDIEGIWLMTITSAVCSFIVSLIFILFKRYEVKAGKYLLVLFLSIPIALLISLTVFVIRYFTAGIVMAIAIIGLIYLIISAGDTIGSASSDETSETKYKVTDEHGFDRELTHIIDNEYKDDLGDTWVSDDGGNTVHRK